MRIFVTGSESFVGKELISQCIKKGIEVVGCDLVEKTSQEYEYHKADIRRPEIELIVPDGVDALIHLAALSRDQDCKGRAYECFDINVMGTLNLMEAAAKKNAKQFIFASTEWVYDNCTADERKTEESYINIANHTSEYALSKLVSEANLRQKYQYGFCSVTILRFGIIYGPRKANWSAIESIMSNVKNQDEIKVGSLKTARRFIHVSDIAGGIIKSLGLNGFETINLTGDCPITLEEIIEASEKILQKKVRVTELDPDRPSIRNPSNEKAKRLLDWKPIIELEEGLKTLLSCV